MNSKKNTHQVKTIGYNNEDDRAYGLAGMAISLAALKALPLVAEISIDADGPMVEFASEYYIVTSPTYSPKMGWDNLVRNFHITSAMVISNLLARSIVRDGTAPEPDSLDYILSEMEAEGADTCSLDADEVKALFDRTLSFSRSIFGNPRLHPAIREFAQIISRRRHLSGTEIEDELQYLQLI